MLARMCPRVVTAHPAAVEHTLRTAFDLPAIRRKLMAGRTGPGHCGHNRLDADQARQGDT